ncbi:glycosyltransferase [Serratia sp. DD3]|uniref:glycosyltransferase n=1 Tax=Serratia sp. DD3 TaxID=1410619 RepID=UPI0004D4AC35|nr:glycosyltransferase [Serratia sp. DD3]KEY57832.1 GDP-mannose-dependent alpha-(1-6)-phosphatidylinositol monomannoside mannosyltransferase [Serratia sp. DD3]
MDTVAIFRNQLFKKSETFITSQSEAIKKYNIFYLGRKAFDNNLNISNYKIFAQNKEKSIRASEVWNALTRDPYAYEKLLKGSEVNLIHAHFAIDSVYALEVAKKIKVPLVTTLHGFDITTSRERFLLSKSPAWINYYFFWNKLKLNADKFICVSDFIANTAVRNGVDENKLIRHYIGVDVDKYQPREYGEEERIILHVARLVEKKGTSTLISALHKIVKKLDGHKLVIIGEGPLYSQLSGQVSSLGLSEHIIFAGGQPHSEVMKWMRKSSMLVLPSVKAKSGDSEGLGMVLLEAAATGLPIIGTRHGGIPEVVIDEKNGYLVDEFDVNSLSEKILHLINDSKLRRIMGGNARTHIVENFNLKIQTTKLEAIYKGLING